jgi:REP element-mobilizing transposase RayT
VKPRRRKHARPACGHASKLFYLHKMAIKLKHSDSYSSYFITFTCIEWISLFELTKAYDLVYNWFDVLKQKNDADVIAFVIMPNHLHAIIHFSKPGFNLNTIIANGKRFVAYQIINRLEAAGNKELLFHLESLVTLREKKKGQLHKVFKDSFDAKPIFSQAFLMQKINYVHHNPVTGKWMLAKNFIDFEHSSASFYEIQLVRYFKPVHYMEL